MSEHAKQELEDILDALVESYSDPAEINNLETYAMPNKRAVIQAFHHIQHLLFLGFFSTRKLRPEILRMALAEHLAFLVHRDRPGMVGTVGGILGEAGVNIAGMQVARQTPGGDVLVVLEVDSALDGCLLHEISLATESSRACAVHLP